MEAQKRRGKSVYYLGEGAAAGHVHQEGAERCWGAASKNPPLQIKELFCSDGNFLEGPERFQMTVIEPTTVADNQDRKQVICSTSL